MDGFTISSPAFAPGDRIPRRHTCEGEDRSPALTWRGVPAGSVSMALVVDDPDAPRGNFVHWLAWGIDPAAGEVAEAAMVPHEGVNDFGQRGWRGPCPPRGRGPHRYVFTLHALDAPIAVPDGAHRGTLEAALRPRIIGTARLVGTYER